MSAIPEITLSYTQNDLRVAVLNKQRREDSSILRYQDM